MSQFILFPSKLGMAHSIYPKIFEYNRVVINITLHLSKFIDIRILTRIVIMTSSQNFVKKKLIET